MYQLDNIADERELEFTVNTGSSDESDDLEWELETGDVSTENDVLTDYVAEMGCYIAKFLPFIVNGDQIKECIHYFDSPFFTVFGDAQKKILNDCKKICKRITTIFLVSVTVGLASWAVKPLFWKNYRLPIDVWFPFDPTSRLTIYSLIYTYLVIGNFVRNYEGCFSLVVFSQFVGSVIVICVSCLQLTMTEPLSFNFFAMVMYLIPMLGEIYLYCYYGTTLYEESNTVTDAIYMGKWYNYDMTCKKALIVLMERSKRPMVVTAGKILDLSLISFTTILRRSYSLLAVLNNYK
ncbi:odorant receptor Or1-like [Tenebrio molitor]|uniref:odorant receptor Or1-like n=1 Tax=Tenebrio molitor TaxID=7067 RepID=UPI003624993E